MRQAGRSRGGQAEPHCAVISLTDHQLNVIMAAASGLPVEKRSRPFSIY
jgi:hypothetical protein